MKTLDKLSNLALALAIGWLLLLLLAALYRCAG